MLGVHRPLRIRLERQITLRLQRAELERLDRLRRALGYRTRAELLRAAVDGLAASPRARAALRTLAQPDPAGGPDPA